MEESKRSNGRDAPLVELTYNWDTEDYGEARFFGHLAYEVDDIYATCEKLRKAGGMLRSSGSVSSSAWPSASSGTPAI